jgi:TPP-dependent pyruvate/acetoin dehydrogenase alpha subunit
MRARAGQARARRTGRERASLGRQVSATTGASRLVTGEQALTLYRTMVRIREVETAIGRLARAGTVPGLVHLSLGAEAAAAGVMAALAEGDVVFSGHRAHGHFLARGGDPARLIAEVMGKASGVCGGRGGSMHIVEPAIGFLGATGVVGGTIPLALGAAFGVRRRGGIAVVFFGDGASTTGVFHECLNLAALWSLPVLFCCENNGIAEFSTRSEQSPVASVRSFAEVYGMRAQEVDGTDAEAVLEAATAAVQVVRSGRPYFLELSVVRLAGHYEGDVQHYRTAAEREQAGERDPIPRLRHRLLNHWAVAESALLELEAEVKEQVAGAVRAAQAAPLPDPAGLPAHV